MAYILCIEFGALRPLPPSAMKPIDGLTVYVVMGEVGVKAVQSFVSNMRHHGGFLGRHVVMEIIF